MWHGSEIKIISGQVFWSSPRRHSNFCLKHLGLNGRDNGDCYFVLKGENVCQVTLEPARPNMHPCHRVNQLPCDTNLPRRLAHGPFEHIAHAELAPDLFY